jgi:hypothetical protein
LSSRFTTSMSSGTVRGPRLLRSCVTFCNRAGSCDHYDIRF